MSALLISLNFVAVNDVNGIEGKMQSRKNLIRLLIFSYFAFSDCGKHFIC